MEQQEQHRTQGFWQSRVECITAVSQWALVKQINEFYGTGKWIVGTQTFSPRHGDGNWTAFVYWKLKA